MHAMTKKSRLIFHVDMDHFFTAVEELRHPELKGKPLIVGADPKNGQGRGVVSTSNYEARKYGVRSGMPISRAWKLCPQATYLPVDYGHYAEVSDRIMLIMRKYADKFERWGIDEAFLDVTDRAKDYTRASDLAKQLKKEIYEKERLTCSIGVSSNKLVAKIASDHHKPDGLTIVKEDEAQDFLSPLSVRKLLWIGRKTGQKLETMGIRTIGDLAHFDPMRLVETFGSMGTQLSLASRGLDNTEVQERSEIKSISREVTFQQDTTDTSLVLETAKDLCDEIIQDIHEQKLDFKTVTLKIRFKNFETHTHGKTLPFFTDRLRDLSKTTSELMRDYLSAGREIRLIGVRVSNFVSGENQQRLS